MMLRLFDLIQMLPVNEDAESMSGGRQYLETTDDWWIDSLVETLLLRKLAS